jgi:ZIP family zinc transporter
MAEYNLVHFCGKQTDDDGSGKDMMKKHRRQVLFSGIITAVGKKLRMRPNH